MFTQLSQTIFKCELNPLIPFSVHVGDLSLRNASPAQILKSLSSMDCINGAETDDDDNNNEFDVRERISEGKGKIGCVWHVFHPADADKIRDYLNRSVSLLLYSFIEHTVYLGDENVMIAYLTFTCLV